MRSSRLLAILILLQLRGRQTGEQLAAEFEVSVRTIYRDMDALSAAGVPIYGDAGPGGGFALLDGYRTHLTGLDSEEERALPFIALPETASALGLGPAASAARHKLLAALPGHGGGLAARAAAAFHADVAEWYQVADSAPYLPLLLTAILDQRRVTMDYSSWKRCGRTTVDPMGIILKGGRYYCVARSEHGLTTYRVAAMTDVQLDTETFVRPDAFDLPGWWAAERARFDAELFSEIATLRVSQLGRQRLAALSPRGAAAVQGCSAEGWVIVEMAIENSDHGAREMLGLGAEVEVLAPVSFRDRVYALAAGIAALNKREA